MYTLRAEAEIQSIYTSKAPRTKCYPVKLANTLEFRERTLTRLFQQ